LELPKQQRTGALYIDITPISCKAALDRSLLAADGLHPSAKMYREWCNLAYPPVRASLR
jgi:hypothetical protein